MDSNATPLANQTLTVAPAAAPTAQQYNLQPTLALLADLPQAAVDFKTAKASGTPALIAFALGIIVLLASTIQGTAPGSTADLWAGAILTFVGAVKSILVTFANHAAATSTNAQVASTTVAVASAVAQVHAAAAAAPIVLSTSPTPAA